MERAGLFIAWMIVLTGAANAGAWPRGEGNLFFSVSYEEARSWETIEITEEDPIPEVEISSYTSLYVEYGLTDKTTIGLDTGSEDSNTPSQVIFFSSYAVSPETWTLKLAAEFGLGRRSFEATPFDQANLRDLEPAGTESILRPGLSLGASYDTFLGSGWTTLDARQEFRTVKNETVTKVDLTTGVTFGKKNSLGYVQFQYSDYPSSDPNIRVVPTYVQRINKVISLQSGVFADVWGSGTRFGTTIGLWLEF